MKNYRNKEWVDEGRLMVYDYPIDHFCERVFEECNKEGIEPFEVPGFISKIAPGIIEEIAETFINSDGSSNKWLYKIPYSYWDYIIPLVERTIYNEEE